MATRSTIAKLTEDGMVEKIYCHWDGYLENNGKILKSFYDSNEKVDELLKNGDLSSLGKSINECVFYIRDRQEDPKQCSAKIIDFDVYQKNHTEEFNYIWRDGKWFYSDYSSKGHYKEV